MLGSIVAGHVVTSVIVKMHALEIRNVAIAIRQHHVESSIVDVGAVEIDRCERKHCLDAVRRTQIVTEGRPYSCNQSRPFNEGAW